MRASTDLLDHGSTLGLIGAWLLGAIVKEIETVVSIGAWIP
jgi:hypothetical protein